MGPLAPRWDFVAGVGRDCRTPQTTMTTKSSTSSATRQQHKRSCPASDYSYTDDDSNCHFAKWLVIESNDSNQPLTRLSPVVLGKALSAQIGTLKSIKRLQRGDVLVETDRRTYSRMLLGLTSWQECQSRSAPTDRLTLAEALYALET